MRLACQEQVLPGDDLLEKWEVAAFGALHDIGFDGYPAVEECGIRGDPKTVLPQVVR